MMDFTFSLSALSDVPFFPHAGSSLPPSILGEVCSYIHYLLPFWLLPIFEDC